MRVGKIYVLGVRQRPDVSKVGMTTGDVEDRVRALQTGNPDEIYAHAVFTLHSASARDVKDIEHFCHQMLSQYRMKGEWFAITPSAAAHLINEELQAELEEDKSGWCWWIVAGILVALFFATVASASASSLSSSPPKPNDLSAETNAPAISRTLKIVSNALIRRILFISPPRLSTSRTPIPSGFLVGARNDKWAAPPPARSLLTGNQPRTKPQL